MASGSAILQFLAANRSRRLSVHCVGDAMVDEYFEVGVSRVSPEAPVAVMTATGDGHCVTRPGGAANVAYQFRHFNADVRLFCFTNRSAETAFRQCGVQSVWGEPGGDFSAPIPVKRRYLNDGVQVIRFDVEAPRCGLSPGQVDDRLHALRSAATRLPDVAILSDYNKGFFSTDYNVLDWYRHTTTIVDPKVGPLSKWRGCTVFKPNAAEAEALTGRTDWKEQAKHIKDETGCETVVVTAGGRYVAGLWRDEFFFHEPQRSAAPRSVVGAGDCFAAFLAMAVGHGLPVPQAVEAASAAGAVYVRHATNRPVCPSDLCAGSVHPEDLVRRDFRLAFTNGVYDLLHNGHIETLKFAKSKADKLVVAVNSDASVRRLKGPSRPVVPLQHRMAAVAALKSVDFVVSFDEDDPRRLIEAIRPDVLVKGAQYEEGQIVGHEIVPEVHRAPMVEGVSTTKLLADYRAADAPT